MHRTVFARFSRLLIFLLLLTACAPAKVLPAATEQPGPLPEPTRPAAAGCEAPGMQSYTGPSGDYCFAFPSGFTLERGEAGAVQVLGPILDPKSIDKLRVRFGLQARPLYPGASLSQIAAQYVSSYHELSGMITRSQTSLGGVPAEVLDHVPGLLSARLVMAVHNDTLYTLSFHPTDVDELSTGLEQLYRAVVSSFTFLKEEPPQAAPPAAQPLEASWLEFDQPMQFHYDPALALWLDTLTIPAVETPLPEQAPQQAVFRFLGYNRGMPAQLPYPLTEARVMIFRTADFAGYGANQSNGYPAQLELLRGLLDAGIDPGICGKPQVTTASGMPFLPMVNASPRFCAHPQLITFAGGRGLRYLTHFSQDAGGVVDWQVFYAFQGLTADGQFYISAVFPVRTGVFPMDQPRSVPSAESTNALLQEQLTRLEALPEDVFDPSLGVLDDLVRSLRIGR